MTDQRPLHEQAPTSRFTSRAAAYARARPDYPAAAFDAMLDALPRPTLAIDIGAGISSRQLADRGVGVIAVEPNAAMREAARPHSAVRFHAAPAEATSLPSGSAHLVLAAQAFHWFRPVDALREFQRLLLPGGRVALLWNERSDDDPFSFAYGRIVREASGHHLAERIHEDPRPFLIQVGLTPRRLTFPHRQRLAQNALIDRATSSSYVPESGPAHAAAVAALHELFSAHADASGHVTLRYTTSLYLADLPHRA